MNKILLGIGTAVIAGAALGLGGWSLAQSAEHEARIAVEEEKSLSNDRDHAAIIKHLEKQDGKLDRILEKLYARDPR